jgi:hypothetical protein
VGIFFEALLYGNIGAGENRAAQRLMNPLLAELSKSFDCILPQRKSVA